MKIITGVDCKPGEPVYAKNWGAVARCRRGRTRSELAKHLGLQVKDIKEIEEGSATPDLEVVGRMAIYLDFPIAHFYRTPDADDDWNNPNGVSFRRAG